VTFGWCFPLIHPMSDLYFCIHVWKYPMSKWNDHTCHRDKSSLYHDAWCLHLYSPCWSLNICVAVPDDVTHVYFTEWRFTLLYIYRLMNLWTLAIYFTLLNILLFPKLCAVTTGAAKRACLPSIYRCPKNWRILLDFKN